MHVLLWIWCCVSAKTATVLLMVWMTLGVKRCVQTNGRRILIKEEVTIIVILSPDTVKFILEWNGNDSKSHRIRKNTEEQLTATQFRCHDVGLDVLWRLNTSNMPSHGKYTSLTDQVLGALEHPVQHLDPRVVLCHKTWGFTGTSCHLLCCVTVHFLLNETQLSFIWEVQKPAISPIPGNRRTPKSLEILVCCADVWSTQRLFPAHKSSDIKNGKVCFATLWILRIRKFGLATVHRVLVILNGLADIYIVYTIMSDFPSTLPCPLSSSTEARRSERQPIPCGNSIYTARIDPGILNCFFNLMKRKASVFALLAVMRITLGTQLLHTSTGCMVVGSTYIYELVYSLSRCWHSDSIACWDWSKFFSFSKQWSSWQSVQSKLPSCQEECGPLLWWCSAS